MIERYSEDTVEAVRRRMQIAIEERQKERTLTKRESVVALQEEIQTMREAGYSLTEIAGLFSEEGITLAPETVRDYVRPRRRTEPQRRSTKCKQLPKGSKVARNKRTSRGVDAEPQSGTVHRERNMRDRQNAPADVPAGTFSIVPDMEK